MCGERRQSGLPLLLRVGAVAAILGSVMQVAAGTASTSYSRGGAEALLSSVAGQPNWLLPAIYLGFICGALCSVGGVVALSAELTDGAAWAPERDECWGAILHFSLKHWCYVGTMRAVGRWLHESCGLGRGGKRTPRWTVAGDHRGIDETPSGKPL